MVEMETIIDMRRVPALLSRLSSTIAVAYPLTIILRSPIFGTVGDFGHDISGVINIGQSRKRGASAPTR